MKTFNVVMRNKFVLLGTAAAILLAAGDVAFSSLFAADAHAAAPVAAPATPVSVGTLKPENLHVWSSFSGPMKAVDRKKVSASCCRA
jgi:multidrug efflux pump subunit AcrA (membrane-fusion protein)